MRHADIKMTANVYGHLDQGRRRNIADGIAQLIRYEIPDGKVATEQSKDPLKDKS